VVQPSDFPSLIDGHGDVERLPRDDFIVARELRWALKFDRYQRGVDTSVTDRTRAKARPGRLALPKGGIAQNLARLMANRFDIGAIGIEHERAIIIGMVIGPDARESVVDRSRRESGDMKAIDLGSRLRGEGDMQAGSRILVIADPEKWLPCRSKPKDGRIRRKLLGSKHDKKLNADGSERLLVESA